jgi:hypothetical protein
VPLIDLKFPKASLLRILRELQIGGTRSGGMTQGVQESITITKV